MRKIGLLTLCFFVTLSSFSQISIQFEKGYYTDNAGIRHEGFIKNEAIGQFNQRFSFKENESASAREFGLQDATGFVIGEETYERISYIEHNGGKNTKTDKTIFARVEGKSLLSLYHSQENDNPIYILKKGEQTYLLKNDYIDGGILQTFDYKLNLQAATAPCITVSRLEKTSFVEKAIKKIVEDYNKCVGESISFRNAGKKKKIDFIQPQVLGSDYGKKGRQITAGIVFRRYFPKLSELTSVNIGLYYFNFSKAGKAVTFHPDDLITYSLFSLPVYVQQNLLKGKVRPFVFAGFAVEYIESIKGKIVFEELLPNGFKENLGLAISLGGGVEWNVLKQLIVKAEIRHETISQKVTFGLAYNLQLKKNK